jgi:transcription-repair coupling factor (superfamily II helicase)
MTDRYGEPPAQVANLIAVARFRQVARAYGLTDVSMQGKHIRFSPLPLPDSKQLRLKRYHPDAVYKLATDQVSVPRPATRRVGGEPLRDQALLQWCAQLLKDVLGEVPTKVPA